MRMMLGALVVLVANLVAALLLTGWFLWASNKVAALGAGIGLGPKFGMPAASTNGVAADADERIMFVTLFQFPNARRARSAGRWRRRASGEITALGAVTG